MDKGAGSGKPRLRNTPNLGVFKTPNLLVLLSCIKFYEFFGLIHLHENRCQFKQITAYKNQSCNSESLIWKQRNDIFFGGKYGFEIAKPIQDALINRIKNTI